MFIDPHNLIFDQLGFVLFFFGWGIAEFVFNNRESSGSKPVTRIYNEFKCLSLSTRCVETSAVSFILSIIKCLILSTGH